MHAAYADVTRSHCVVVGDYTTCIGLITQLLQNLAVLKTKTPAFIAEKIWNKEMQGAELLKTAGIDLPKSWWEVLDASPEPPESLADFVREYASKVFEAPRT